MTDSLVPETFWSALDAASPDVLVCGFSGGADSTALLMLMVPAARRMGIPLHAVHCHHGLREAADDDALWCRALALKFDIPFHQVDLQVPDHQLPHESMETAARRLRYAAFQTVADMVGQRAAVLLGHHADDALENIFLRLMRGANVSGLTAPRRFRPLGNHLIVRPLLQTTHAEIIDYLLDCNQDWREDHTNGESCCARNFLRLEILPLLYAKFSYGRQGCAASLDALRADADFLESSAQTAWRMHYDAEKKVLLREGFSSLHAALQIRVLRYWFESLGCFHIPNRAFFLRICHALGSETVPVSVPVGGGWTVRADARCLTLISPWTPSPSVFWDPLNTPEVAFGEFCFSATVIDGGPSLDLSDGGLHIGFFDLDLLNLPLILRYPVSGDVMTVFGGHSHKKVSRVACDAGLAAHERNRIPLLCQGLTQDVLWFTGVRRGACAPVTESTLRILKITFYP